MKEINGGHVSVLGETWSKTGNVVMWIYHSCL